MPVSTSDIQRTVDLIVENLHPDRVVLFGSHATNSAQDQSDVDLLVLVPPDHIYRSLKGVGFAKDILLFHHKTMRN